MVKRRHRLVSLAVCAAMLLSLCPQQAVAEPSGGGYDAPTPAVSAASEPDEPENSPAAVQLEGQTQTYHPAADGLPGNDELFAGYVQRTLYGGAGVSTLGSYGETVLEGTELAIYKELKTAIGKIAAGEVSSTDISITSDLGIESWVTTKSGNELLVEAAEKFNAAIDTGKIIDCLMVDCPYELYWYNKVQDGGVRTGYDIRISTNTVDGVSTTTASIINLTFSFSVANAYQDDGDPYTTDTTKTGAASAAAANAQAVITANDGKTDYEKLLAYRDYICGAVSYNNDAASDGYIGGYGDPWQLIYVFDGDPNTSVVCEGYAKAFQYLCDLGGLTCYTVTGTMSGGTGAGAHMWNIVTLDGENYLVDVTNSDTDTVGQDGGLFLAGTSGSVDVGYTFTAGGQEVTFQYDADTAALYGTDILTLSATDYTEPEPEPAYVASVTIDGTATAYTDIQSAFTAANNGTEAAPATVQLLADAQVPAGGNINVTGTVVLEGGEHTISGAYRSEYAFPGLVLISPSGHLTVQSGTIYNEIPGDSDIEGKRQTIRRCKKSQHKQAHGFIGLPCICREL